MVIWVFIYDLCGWDGVSEVIVDNFIWDIVLHSEPSPKEERVAQNWMIPEAVFVDLSRQIQGFLCDLLTSLSA